MATPLKRRARESNPQRLAPHLISSQAANHSRTLRKCLRNIILRYVLLPVKAYACVARSRMATVAGQLVTGLILLVRAMEKRQLLLAMRGSVEKIDVQCQLPQCPLERGESTRISALVLGQTSGRLGGRTF